MIRRFDEIFEGYQNALKSIGRHRVFEKVLKLNLYLNSDYLGNFLMLGNIREQFSGRVVLIFRKIFRHISAQCSG